MCSFDARNRGSTRLPFKMKWGSGKAHVVKGSLGLSSKYWKVPAPSAKLALSPDTPMRMAVCSCGRLLTQILEMRMISQFFSHQSSGTVRDRLPVACSCRCSLNSYVALNHKE